MHCAYERHGLDVGLLVAGYRYSDEPAKTQPGGSYSDVDSYADVSLRPSASAAALHSSTSTITAPPHEPDFRW